MSYFRFKQTKPLTPIFLGLSLAIIWILFILFYSAPIPQLIILFILAFILLGYSIHIEISAPFTAKKCFGLYGYILFKKKHPILHPEYIVVLPSRFSGSSEWGPVSALGNKTITTRYVIRLFSGTKRFDLYKTKSLDAAKRKASSLAHYFDLPCHIKVP